MKFSNNNKRFLGIFNYQSYNYFFLAGILILTIYAFSATYSLDFINWDDDKLVIDNPYVKKLSSNTFNEYFSLDIIQKYDPLTVLTHAITYKIWKFNPAAYHLINLFFHLFNVIFVFWLVQLLFKHDRISIIVALLFAIHPTRVESVAWVAERKDLLYTFFYLGSVISYLFYFRRNNKIIFYLISILLFILSLLSKFSAVTLPVFLILIDLFQRKINKKILLEKLPFFILSVLMGLMLFTNPLATSVNFNLKYNFQFVDRIFLSGYSLMYYIYKSILPFNLIAFHPYPVIKNGLLPSEYYLISIIAVFALITFIWLLIKYIAHFKVVFFGACLFLINIGLVVHIVPFGGWVVVADRYTYVAYLGLFIILAELAIYIYDNKSNIILKIKPLIIGLFIIIVISFVYITHERTKVWKNNFTFWNEIIRKDSTNAFAYNGRGIYYKDHNDLKPAFADFRKAILLRKDFEHAYNNCGTVLISMNDYSNAIKFFDKAILLNPLQSLGWYNRAIAHEGLQEYQAAINDYSKSINNNINVPQSYLNIGAIKYNLKDYPGAKADFNDAIKLSKDFIQAYYNRALVNYDMKNYQSAISDYLTTISLKPDYFQAYNNLGYTLSLVGNYNKSIEYLNIAISIKPDLDFAYNNRGFAKYKLKQFNNALKDYNFALSLNPVNSEALINRGLTRLSLNDTSSACQDFQKAYQLKNMDAEKYIIQYCRLQ